uniref:Uncharacterized protein n=1 Tax=Anguilla anguilla TaxID=7936 RepID=A0A0E9TRY1_ANGAN
MSLSTTGLRTNSLNSDTH